MCGERIATAFGQRGCPSRDQPFGVGDREFLVGGVDPERLARFHRRPEDQFLRALFHCLRQYLDAAGLQARRGRGDDQHHYAEHAQDRRQPAWSTVTALLPAEVAADAVEQPRNS